jgi:hypothetical protein
MVSIEELRIGTVIDIRDPYSFHEKHKYSIIIGISHDKFYIGTVFINSIINPHAINSPELVALQYEISSSKYKFLRSVSYVDCSDLKDRMQSSLLQEINTSGRILGNIAKDDLSAIIQLVLDAETISAYYKSICNVVQPA